MTWQDYLTRQEAAKLERLQRKRDEAKAEFNDERLVLKSRAEARMRREQEKAARDD